MMTRVEPGRALLAAITSFIVAVALVLVAVPRAEANHIPGTGTVPGNCVEFQAGNTGSKVPSTHPGVTITLDSWTNTPGDPHTVNFTISGLQPGEWVDISVKSGTEVQEAGPYSNGSHSYSNAIQNGMSHIRLCVFGQPTTTSSSTTTSSTTSTSTTTTQPTTTSSSTTTSSTTTTQPTTTTTTTQPTTTTSQATTTTQGTTPTTQETTTTTSTTVPTVTEEPPTEVSDTEVSAEQEPEVEGTEVLPFTGAETDVLLGLAVAMFGLGVLFLVAARGREES